MSKPLIGLLLGAVLGALDGLSALVSSPNAPAVKEGLAGIVMGSTFKGIVAGVAAGFFARRFRSVPLGLAFGLALGFLFALLVAIANKGYYLEIILPGSLVGLIVGYATQRYGRAPAPRST